MHELANYVCLLENYVVWLKDLLRCAESRFASLTKKLICFIKKNAMFRYEINNILNMFNETFAFILRQIFIFTLLVCK